MKLVLIHPPFCTPTVPPHSITHLAAFIRHNSEINAQCLDLNAKFHKMKFPALYKRLEKAKHEINPYSEMLEKYSSSAKKVHRQNNLKMAQGLEPELFSEMLDLIMKEKPDAAGISFVYNSQIFYGLKLAEALEKNGIKCLAGGPAAGKTAEEKLKVLSGGKELLAHLTGKEECEEIYAPDFTQYPAGDYLSREMIYPVRSSHGCSHGGCAFCTHHGDVPYREIDMGEIGATIRKNGMRNLFFIDDNIPAERLLALAGMLQPLGVKWWCQTRPAADLLGHFPELRKGGLTSLSMGIESGSQRMLDLMGKGTDVSQIEKLLAESHAAGIRNIAFIMFGFPGEDETSFMETMDFLRRNRESIDIVSASVFGLQRGSKVYQHPERYGVSGITARDTPLGETIAYEVGDGLGEAETHLLKEKHDRELRGMSKLPKIFGLLKEQSLFF